MNFLDARLPDRFWDKVTPEPNSGCWLWVGSTCNGYGRFNAGTNVRAHRHAYAALVGPVPDGLHLDHMCRQTCCVNPAHLEPVTNAENARRGEAGVKSAALQRAKTHCPKGHQYDEINTYFAPRTQRRQCLKCRAVHRLASQRRIREGLST